jgi:hypothetical protein
MTEVLCLPRWLSYSLSALSFIFGSVVALLLWRR